MRPPVLEDRVAWEARRLLAAQKEEEKDAAKKCQVCKTLEQEALKKRRRQQSLDGLPLEESPSETVSREDDDSDDDNAWSRYDTATSLADLPDVRLFLEPIRGSTS
jgi:ribosome biogenesis protein Tsr3